MKVVSIIILHFTFNQFVLCYFFHSYHVVLLWNHAQEFVGSFYFFGSIHFVQAQAFSVFF